MPRKSVIQIIHEVISLLKKEGELSTRQIAFKVRSQWRTIDKVLALLLSLGIIKKRKNDKTKRIEALYSIK